MIYYIDTNFLLRLLLKDHPQQFKVITNFLVNLHNKDQLVIEPLVINEALFVATGKIYKYSKQEFIDQVLKLLQHPKITTDDKGLLISALIATKNSSLAFIDCWLAEKASPSRSKLLSFDREIFKQYPLLEFFHTS